MNKITRREFIQSGTVGISFFFLQNNVVDASFPTKYELIASKSSHKFADNLTRSSLWLYNKACPGPLITARKG